MMTYHEWGRSFKFGRYTVNWYNEKGAPAALGFCYSPNAVINLFLWRRTLSIQWFGETFRKEHGL
jgi:hypothetical protein